QSTSQVLSRAGLRVTVSTCVSMTSSMVESAALPTSDDVGSILVPDVHGAGPSLDAYGGGLLCDVQRQPVLTIANGYAQPLEPQGKLRIEPQGVVADLEARVAALYQIHRARHGADVDALG